MTTETINSVKYRSLLFGASGRLQEKCDQINKLNVFPVPDGDTGDNMLMTLQSGLAETEEEEDLSLLCENVSKGMLYGARGNSGVILSRFFYGLNDCLSKRGEEVTTKGFIDGMEKGVSEAYASVSSPKEGTTLTVMRETFEYVKKESPSDFETLFERANTAAADALKKTPEQLEVLKNAGVVDSGGAGFLCILEGMKSALKGGTDARVTASKTRVKELSGDEEMLGYCTEFLLQRMGNEPFSLDAFKEYLDSVGSSVVIFETGNVVKVHVHTFRPEDVLAAAHRFGEFLTLKIENMTVMHTESTVDNEFEIFESKKKYGIVAAACGEGVKQMLENSGCTVVDGGRSMNPSAQDILQGIRSANAETVFVFPNHKNTFMAAKQAADMCDFCKVTVINSRDVGHCYYALSFFDDSLAPEELTRCFEEAFGMSRTVNVAKATRSCTEDGVTVREGDFLCFDRDRILLAEKSENEAAFKLLKGMETPPDVVIVLVGEDQPADAASELDCRLTEAFPDTEIIMINGGQPIYAYTLIIR
ncbi:MAG: DAK2 domain-containing protein [Clostridia bacterium]|nr:DAK2 domain-containing protein [Clostridia bacterium]